MKPIKMSEAMKLISYYRKSAYVNINDLIDLALLLEEWDDDLAKIEDEILNYIDCFLVDYTLVEKEPLRYIFHKN